MLFDIRNIMPLRESIMTKSLTTLLVVVVLMTGCASMDTVMSSWVGRPIDDVSSAWGAPESKMNLADGGVTYTWTTFSSNQYGVRQCRQSFVTDPSGTIISWSYSGCPIFVRKW